MTSQPVPILMYHSISNVSSTAFRPFTVTPDAFEAQLSYLREQGYTTLTVTEFIKTRKALPAKPVILTFDDGFADFYTTALPLLKKYRSTATLYITTGEIGGTSRWLATSDEGERAMLTWEQIIDIHHNGVEIGGHTISHPALDMIPYQQAWEEIIEPKRILEEYLNAPVTSFAYPFGYNSRDVRKMTREAGYTSACAVRYDMSSPQDDPFALARHIVRRDTSIEQFADILSGNLPLLPLAYDRLRSTVWTAVRRIIRGFKNDRHYNRDLHVYRKAVG